VTRARAASFLLCAALVGAGCGGEDEGADRFREGYNAAVQRLNEVNSNIEESGRELAARPGSEIAREFDRIADTAARTRADLAELEPPEDARDEFDDLLAAIQDGVENIRGVANAAREGNQDRFREATERLSESGEEISQAEEALKDAVGG
jgi:methyl-accepting chemotaxis protein